ncbi:MAG: hypothetical protein ACLFTA_03345 [Candidatus Nanohaloarchaea archaeon]
MAHHYSGGTPEEHERSKAERISALQEIAELSEEGEISFEGVHRALHSDKHREAEMRIEGLEMAKKDDSYFEVLEAVYSTDKELKEEIWRESDYNRTEFFSTVADLNSQGYVSVNGTIELTETGENALLGTYLLMEEYSE